MRYSAVLFCLLLVGSGCAGSDNQEPNAFVEPDVSVDSEITVTAPPTATTQWKPTVKTTPSDQTWVGGNKAEPAYHAASGDCVEVFMFEESDEPFDQESVFEYSVTKSEFGMTVRPRIMGCDQLPYLRTKNEGGLLTFEVRRPLTTYSDQFNLFWVLAPGEERFYGTFPEGRTKSQPTATNHVWVVRLKPPTESAPTTTVVGGEASDSAAKVGAGDCIEAFMFEESDEPSDTNSILEYTFSPSNPDTNVRLRILRCDVVPYLASIRDGTGVEFTFQLNADEYTELDLTRIDVGGIESTLEARWVNFPDGTLQPVQTFAGHVFVVRHARPQPTIAQVDRCELMEHRQPFKFRKETIQGWQVWLECVIDFTPTLMESILEALDDDLEQINSFLPDEVLGRLKTATPFFVVASDDAKTPGQMREGKSAAVYQRHDQHVDASTVMRTPLEYAGAVIISADGFHIVRDWQPAGMTLHELAHAWHCLNWDPCMDGAEQISAAYDAAMTSGIYDLVERNNGEIEDAYAAKNDREYFAELTEAWFWENDYYPYNREQLLAHDPVGAAAVEAAWTVND